MEVIELKKLFSNLDIQNMELKDLIEMINYKDFDVLLEKIKNKKDIDFYIEFQDLFTRRKQKEAIEKGIY
ncbi:hypothetical protein JMUB3933_1998 [Leptotrichia wadei]|uniref:Uncharacterized protein n=1 Tax=Leptotrichia wadei TaxID=157687 RepID=A0A510K9Z4_9FUSO|nr:hypothetical protein [Leptotrichia wadei]BBM48482.1 hypothetical protein JMUB3933_1998 [Leptotrichia wadei]